MSNVKNMMNMFNFARNPQQTLMNMAQSNPQVQEVMKMCEGKNPKDVFYQKCKDMNIDPNEILKMMKLKAFSYKFNKRKEK
jgi:hypothetical protein